MISRWITALACVPSYVGEMDAQTRLSLASHLPKSSLRRMSEGDVIISHMLNELKPSVEEPLVTVSTFAHARSLECFIDSFPTPSPARFQRSIHPAGVQQHCVTQQSPLHTFLPLAGHEGAAIVALRSALSMNEESVCLASFEEPGTWSVAVGAGSETGFGFALRLEKHTCKPACAIGRIEWDSRQQTGFVSETASLDKLHAAVLKKLPFCTGDADHGYARLLWL